LLLIVTVLVSQALSEAAMPLFGSKCAFHEIVCVVT
jgi:hypothetical protein